MQLRRLVLWMAIFTITFTALSFSLGPTDEVYALEPLGDPRVLWLEGEVVPPVVQMNRPRMPGQIGCYTRTWGQSTYSGSPCVEVVVDGGYVQKIVEEADSDIPENGFILSADGLGGAWLKEYIAQGSRAEVRLAPDWNRSWEAVVQVGGSNMQRAADTLVIYTPSFMNKTTQTNIFGIEAVVNNGVVTSLGTNNRTIPPDGFVISGHGWGKEWMLQNLREGTQVKIDRDMLFATNDASAFIRDVETDWSLLMDELTRAKGQLGIPSPLSQDSAIEVRSTLDRAWEDWHAANHEEAIWQALRAYDVVRNALMCMSTSRRVELRGVWHRPTERNPEDVMKTVERLVKAGFNSIFLETFWSGKAIYPNEAVGQSPAFIGWDPLRAFIEAGHARGIEVHVWIHTLRFSRTSQLLTQNPEWRAAKRSQETELIKTDSIEDFADPSNPEVCEFVIRLIRDLATRYEVDGIHLDYIRWSSSGILPDGYELNEGTCERFSLAVGVDPSLISPGNPTVWKEWERWRTDRVTNLVRDLRKAVLAVRPSAALSAAVAGEPGAAQKTKLQAWLDWVKEGLLDFAVPMLYHTDASWVGSASLKSSTASAGLVPVASGVGTFLGLDAGTSIRQIEAARTAGSQGISLFALHSLSTGIMRVLAHGVFHRPAVLPYGNPEAVKLGLQELAEDLQRLGASPDALSLADELHALSNNSRLPDVLGVLVRIQQKLPAIPGLAARLDELISIGMALHRWNMARALP